MFLQLSGCVFSFLLLVLSIYEYTDIHQIHTNSYIYNMNMKVMFYFDIRHVKRLTDVKMQMLTLSVVAFVAE